MVENTKRKKQRAKDTTTEHSREDNRTPKQIKKDEAKEELENAKKERVKGLKTGFFKIREYNILKPFMGKSRSTENRSLFKDTIHAIGLDFNISLLEDIKKRRKENAEYNNLQELTLYTLVSLFSDHLLRKRIDLNNLEKEDNSHFFQKCDTTNYYFTKQQYRISLSYFYKIKRDYSVYDPLLKYTRPIDTEEMKHISRYDSLKTIRARTGAVKKLVDRIQKSKYRKETNNENEFIMIYNRSVDLVNEIMGGGNSILLGDKYKIENE